MRSRAFAAARRLRCRSCGPDRRRAHRAAAVFEHLFAEDGFLEQVEELFAFGLLLFGKGIHGLVLALVHAAIAFELFVLLGVEGVLQLGGYDLEIRS